MSVRFNTRFLDEREIEDLITWFAEVRDSMDEGLLEDEVRNLRSRIMGAKQAEMFFGAHMASEATYAKLRWG